MTLKYLIYQPEISLQEMADKAALKSTGNNVGHVATVEDQMFSWNIAQLSRETDLHFRRSEQGR